MLGGRGDSQPLSVASSQRCHPAQESPGEASFAAWPPGTGAKSGEQRGPQQRSERALLLMLGGNSPSAAAAAEAAIGPVSVVVAIEIRHYCCCVSEEEVFRRHT